MPSARATSRCWCSTSPTRWCPSRWRDFCAASARVLVVEEGQPEYIEQEIAHRCCAGATSRRAARQGPAAGGGRVQRRGAGDRARPASSSATCPAMRTQRSARRLARRATRDAPRRESPRALDSAAAEPAAELLHRLPGAAGVRGAQAGAAGHRPGAHRGRHRLPRLRHLRAVLDGATRSSATA